MNKFIRLSLVAALAISTSVFADESKEANSIQEMFSKGTVSGQIRLGYAANKTETAGAKDTSATAIGGQLKFETAAIKGFSLGVAMYTSHAISGLSGDAKDGEFNGELTSDNGQYTEVAESYINFDYEGFNFRGGRQLIDTPLADSDDIRMTPHTFEAYIASYTLKDLGLSFIAGSVLNWQGVDSDYANVTNGVWAKTGEDGTYVGAVTYSNDIIEASAWYYDVTKAASAIYTDVTGTIAINDDIEIVVAAQYLGESEKDNAAGAPSTIEGSIIGAMVEAGIYGATLSVAYDSVSVKDGNQIFEGFGGGSSYTNIDTMTAGTLHDGTVGDGSSYTIGAAYEIAGVNIFGVYGDYQADAVTGGVKAHVTEINVGLEYEYNEGEADVAFIYVIGEDKESSAKTDFDNDRIQLVMNYNF
ncbi:OprD family outer membrane porin [Sulfurimonas sp.]|uniref:OprD family outer membrane porin n=1 Tax=Sulfurimonas sp. TaxID=2022749 RepID=UPI002AAF72B1|nr:OprD family outer membrane porin [Sulfurimonas sp.]